ncbi:MAG TPA: hypothetical protein DIT25_03355 [Candidatus Moranbacteria bacterium]|nr:hypothetical protein [Candidatus Moranbacteria bacterium]
MGILVVTYFVMGYFGYDVNLDYFKDRKAACQEKIKDCTENLVRQGIDNAKCDMNCVDPKLIIKQK